jgi:hypothetical protein
MRDKQQQPQQHMASATLNIDAAGLRAEADEVSLTNPCHICLDNKGVIACANTPWYRVCAACHLARVHAGQPCSSCRNHDDYGFVPNAVTVNNLLEKMPPSANLIKDAIRRSLPSVCLQNACFCFACFAC